MAKAEDTTTVTAPFTAHEAEDKLVNVSVTLPASVVAMLDEARWELRQGSRSGAARHIIEAHFNK